MKVTVITIVKNSASTILQCMRSVRSQDHRDIEYIVIDGNSTDGTSSLIANNAALVDVYVRETDAGLYHAMNKGISLATGDVIGFLNSDDFFATTSFVSKIAQKFSSSETTGVVFSDLIYVDKERPDQIHRVWQAGEYSAGAFSRGWAPPHPTCYVRSEVLKDCGLFDVRYRLAADTELLMRIMETNRVQSSYMPIVGVCMRLGGETNASLRNIIKQNLEIRSALKENNISFCFPKLILGKLISRARQKLRARKYRRG